jgi:hypothetical protein
MLIKLLLIWAGFTIILQFFKETKNKQEKITNIHIKKKDFKVCNSILKHEFDKT